VAGLDAVDALIGRRFVREEPRARAGVYVRGLLAGLERKNGWTLAEHAGAVSPDGMQRLLRTADWDIEGVRDDVRDYALDHLGDPVTGVFVLDDPGFIKKGRRSAGVQRQYTGTIGKIDNCQLGVFLAYASSKGRALIDRELYLPVSWTEDPDRCAKAGIPPECCAEGGFATKPELGVAMLNRAYRAQVLTSVSWVTADEAYGQNPAFREWLTVREIPFVLATRNDDLLTSPDGHRRQAKVLATIAGVGEDGQAGAGWERRSIGPGAHGERDYDWTAVALDTTGLPDGWGHWLLVRRQAQPGEGKTVRELAFYRCAGPATTPLRELIRVAGARWAIEECFQTAKNEAGLDHYQVRTWRAWYAHITLAMLALAHLAATRAREHQHDHALTSEKGELQPATNG
jgi:SRSO17 transposase